MGYAPAPHRPPRNELVATGGAAGAGDENRESGKKSKPLAEASDYKTYKLHLKWFIQIMGDQEYSLDQIEKEMMSLKEDPEAKEYYMAFEILLSFASVEDVDGLQAVLVKLSESDLQKIAEISRNFVQLYEDSEFGIYAENARNLSSIVQFLLKYSVESDVEIDVSFLRKRIHDVLMTEKK